VSGDVEGNFAALFARVGKVHASKAGPFHALLCVGSFFGRKGAQELTEFIQGTKEGQRCHTQASIQGGHNIGPGIGPSAALTLPALRMALCSVCLRLRSRCCQFLCRRISFAAMSSATHL
jgi:hypothetical protein